MTSPVVSNATDVILGASGNTGSVVADFLLSKGENPLTSGPERCREARLNRTKFFRSRFQLREEIFVLESVFIRGRAALTVVGSRRILG
jgi:hypothetical protein